jgi:hypothetical protein
MKNDLEVINPLDIVFEQDPMYKNTKEGAKE